MRIQQERRKASITGAIQSFIRRYGYPYQRERYIYFERLAESGISIFTYMEYIRMHKEVELTDSQRAQLLLLYKSKLQSLGDEAFFDQFDSIRRQCYDEIGIDLEEMEAMERSKAASKLGKHGGESTSEAKSQAARENGKRGGRKKSTNQPSNQLGLSLEDI